MTTHGSSKTNLYDIYRSIIQRCYNPNNKQYKDHGGRGIKVCDYWLESFENFKKDVEPRPAKNYGLDRIDNNGDYEPANCRWADKTIQSINQRLTNKNKSGINGVSWHKSSKSWIAQISINKRPKHLGCFKTKEEAASARYTAEDASEHAEEYQQKRLQNEITEQK